jgi:hypothetical protein
MAKSQVEGQRGTDVPVILEIPAEEYLTHMPVRVLGAGQLYVKLLRARLQEIGEIVERVGAITSAAATDLLIPVVFKVYAHPERMHTTRDRQTIGDAPKLLLIVRLVHAITNRRQGADNDFTQQAPSRPECEVAQIPLRKRDVLDWVRKV